LILVSKIDGITATVSHQVEVKHAGHGMSKNSLLISVCEEKPVDNVDKRVNNL